MKPSIKLITALVLLALYLISMLAFTSALVVDADYKIAYPGEEVSIGIDVDNNFGYDIEDISIQLILDDVPFTSVGSSEKSLDDLDDGDDDSKTFTLKASTSTVPGDYDIPYIIRYTNAEETNATSENKTGSFGIRISAKTELDFSVESSGDTTDTALVGGKGKISLKVINQGLGEIKFVSVQIFPSGFELTSGDKIYIGTIDSDDSDFATFDVIFKNTNPTLSAKVNYKDFDNKDQSKTVSLPIKVYTREKALELGLIQNPNYLPYGIGAGVLILWYIIRKARKARKKNKQKGGN